MHKKNAYLFFFNVYFACILATCFVGIQGSEESSDPITLETLQKQLKDEKFNTRANSFRVIPIKPYWFFAHLAVMVRIYAPNSLKDLQDQIEEMRNKAFTTEQGKETYNAQIYLANQLTEEEWNTLFKKLRTPTYGKTITAIQDGLGYAYSTIDKNSMTDKDKEHFFPIILIQESYKNTMKEINTFISKGLGTSNKSYNIDDFNEFTNGDIAYEEVPKEGDIFNYQKMDVEGEAKNMFKAFSDTVDLVQSHEHHDSGWSTTNKIMLAIGAIVITFIAALVGFYYHHAKSAEKKADVIQQAKK